MINARNVVVKVPTRRARAPKLASLPVPGLGIHLELVKKWIQSSRGTIGAASLKIKRKMATMAMMLLQPQTRMSHSMGLSSKSRKRNFLRAAMEAGCDIGSGLMQRDEAFLLDDLLAGGRENPI